MSPWKLTYARCLPTGMQDLVDVITGRSNARGDAMFDSDNDESEEGDEESGDDYDEDSESRESGSASDEDEAPSRAADVTGAARSAAQVS